MSEVQRFDSPSKPTLLEMFRAFRGYLEKTTSGGLDPAWYEDGPEDKPELYKHQPEVLAALERKRQSGTPPEST